VHLPLLRQIAALTRGATEYLAVLTGDRGPVENG
jgi:hypothetical protein